MHALEDEITALRRALRGLLDRARPIPLEDAPGSVGWIIVVDDRRAWDAAVAALGGWREEDETPAEGPAPQPVAQPMAEQPATPGWYEYGGPWGPVAVMDPRRVRADAEDDWGGVEVATASEIGPQSPPLRRPGVP